tara:strand:+ start:397 stop:714 length:318 start_codon:yes stop_codon:yes gene_type:complete
MINNELKKAMDEVKKVIKELFNMIENVNDRLCLMADIQHSIVNFLGEQYPEYKKDFIMSTISNDKVREEFTNFINKIDVSDEIKVQLMDLNEQILEAKREEENNA